jgi:hypothetical protein
VAGIFGRTKARESQFFNPDKLLDIYQNFKTIYPSKISPIIKQIAKARIDCYASSPLNRLQGNCLTTYREDLLSLGRSEIDSAPDVGLFLYIISNCPIINSVCLGQGESQEECITMESLCLESVYDNFWRGKPFPFVGSNQISKGKVRSSALY